MLKAWLAIALLLAIGGQARGQELNMSPAGYDPLTDEMKAELAMWSVREKVFQAWAKKYYNLAVDYRGWRIRIKHQPPAPEWLPVLCKYSRLDEYTDEINAACALWREGGEDLEIESYFAHRDRAAQEDDGLKNKWWNNVHFDFGYTNTKYQRHYNNYEDDAVTTPRIIGYFGVHYTPFQLGRVKIYGPPGFLHTGDNTLLTWGVSLETVEVKIPGAAPMALYLNLVKAWSVGGNSALASQAGMDMGGVSLTWKVRR